jgi:ubiquinone/menaquinone biosynthesis C-methylase UbiE
VIARARLAVAVAAAVVMAHVVLHAQQASLTSEVSRLVELLELRSDSVVADVGAGSGEVSVEMAKQLGPTSRVFATDINAQRIADIKQAATKAALTNLVALEGAPASTNLTEACGDALFVRYVYHHFANPAAMNASILRSLERGGRFAVMDGPRNAKIGVPPAERASGDTHGVARETVVEDLKTAGFEIVTVLPEWPGNLFLILARKPAR